MSKYKKLNFIRTIFVIILLFLMVCSIGITLALNSDEIKIEIGEIPNIDVVLSKTKTKIDLNNFKNDLLAELEEQGISEEKINIDAIEVGEANIQSSFNWSEGKDVSSTIGSITIDSTGSNVVMKGNSRYAGKNAIWIIPEGNQDQEFNFSYNIDFGDSFNAAGMLLRVQRTGNTLKGYMLSFNQPNMSWATASGLGGIWEFTYVIGQNTVNMTKTLKKALNISKSGSLNVKASDTEIVISGGGLANPVTYKTEKMFGNGFGFFSDHYSHSCAQIGSFKLSNLELRTSAIKSFKEVIQQPSWRENSLRFLVNVEDEINQDYEDETYLANISTNMINNNIHFLGWGTEENKTQVDKIVESNNNKGEYIDNTDYEAAIQRTAEYIKAEVEKYETASKTKNYVLLDMEHKITVDPEEIRENTTDRLYTDGKWKVNHDYEYFENNNGQYSLSGKYTDGLIESFDKVGKYEIIYQKDTVAEVYVHRKPIAVFSVELNGTNVTLNDLSYDLDEQSKNNGISEVEWSYKKVTDTEWTIGKLNTIEEDSTYMIRLRVKDNQETWSDYETKYVTTKEGEPVAAFQIVNNKTSIYENLEIVDTSYDPSGIEIIEKKWTLYKDGEKIYSGVTAPEDFSQYGIGEYKLTLVVKNANNVESEEYKQNFSIIDDEIAPEIIVDKPEANSLSEIKVNVSFADKGGSGFNSYKYAITDSKDAVTEWSEDIEESTKEFVLNELGEQYIHIIAKDNAGNETDEIVLGPYVIEPKQFELEIEKYDSNDDTVKLGGIEFVIEQPSSDVFETRKRNIITDENGNGKVILDIIGQGEHTYKISETESMLGYEELADVNLKINFDEDGNIITAEEDSDKVEVVEKTNEKIKLRIANVKMSFDDDGGNTGNEENINSIKFNIKNIDENSETIENVKYQIKIEDNTGKAIVREVTTDKDGNIQIDNIPFNKIVSISFKQIEIPDEYIIDSNEKNVIVMYNEEKGIYEINDLTKADIVGVINNETGDVQITVINYKKAERQKLRLELNAKNDTDLKINGQELKVILPYRTGEKILTTNEKGIIEMELESPGPGDHLYTISPSATTDEYNIQEIKVIITFDKNGNVTKVEELTNLLSKKEIVKDIDEGIAYNCVDLVYSLDMSDLYGSQKFRIELQDYDYNVKKIPGASYQIQIETESGINTVTKITDSLGEITLELPKRDWVKLTIEQIKTIEGYTLESSQKIVMLKLVEKDGTKKLEVDNKETTSGLKIEEKGTDKIITLILDNVAKLSDSKDVQGTIDFFITKKDLQGNLLGNVAFELEETVTGVKETLVTDENGYVELPDIEIPGEGKYEFKIHELNTVNGYELPDTEIIMDVIYEKIDGELKTSGIIVKKGYKYIENKQVDEYETPETFQADFTMIILNNAKPLDDGAVADTLEITKSDKEGKALEGAEFEIKVDYPNGTSVKNTYKTEKKSEDSKTASFKIPQLNIEEGEEVKITIKETKAPLGYKLDESEKVIVVKKEEGKLVIVEEKSTADLLLEIQNGNDISLKLENEAIEKEDDSNNNNDNEPENVESNGSLTINKSSTKGSPIVGATFEIKIEYEDGISKTVTATTKGTKYENVQDAMGNISEGVCTEAGIDNIDFTIKDEEDNVIRDIQEGEKVKITIKEISAPGYILDKEEKVIVVKRENNQLQLIEDESSENLSLSISGKSVEINLTNQVEPEGPREPDFNVAIYKTDLDGEYQSILNGVTYSISVEYEDGTIKTEESIVKANYHTEEIWFHGERIEKEIFDYTGTPAVSLHYVENFDDKDPSNDIEKYLQDGEKAIIRIKETSAPDRCVIDPVEKIIVVQREGSTIKLIREESTEGFSMWIDESGKNLKLKLENEILPEEDDDGNNNPGYPGPNDPSNPNNPYEEEDRIIPTTVVIQSVSKYTDDWVKNSRFQLIIKNSKGEVIKTLNSKYSTESGGIYDYNTVTGFYTSSAGEYTVEIQENVAGYLHKLNPEKYTLVFNRYENGTVKINQEKTSKELEAKVRLISNGENGTRGVYVKIKNEPAYGLTINKVDSGKNYSISGAGFSIIEEEFEFDENAFVSGYGVTIGGNALLQVRNQDPNTTRRYVITEEVIPDGYNRMGEYGKVLIEIKTDKYGYIEDAQIIEKEGYDGEDVCELIYSEDEEGNKNLAKIRIKDEAIAKSSYSLKIEKVDKDNNVIKLQGAEFDININYETMTYFEGPLNAEPPYEFNKIVEECEGGYDIDRTVITNASGIARINGIRGTGQNIITIRETEEPIGYYPFNQTIRIVLDRDVTMETKEDGKVVETGHLTLKSATKNNVDVTIDHEKQEVKVVIKDTLEYDIIVNKQSTNGKNLIGAEFTLEKEIFSKDKSGNWISDAKLNENLETITLTTNKYGRLGYIEDYLPNKMVKYTLKEVKAPYMYLAYEDPIVFTIIYDSKSNIKESELISENIDEDGANMVAHSCSEEDDVVTLTVKDKFDPSFLPNNNNNNEETAIQLVKEDKEDKTLKLEGGTFQFIFEKDGELSNSVIETTDENGEINFSEVWKDNVTIKITELMAPEGYRDYEDEIEIQLEKDENGNILVSNGDESENEENIDIYEVQYDETNKILKVIVRDELKDPAITISKVCSDDKTLKITDVAFKIKDETTDEIYDLITGPDGSGTVLIKGKEKGTYEFRIKEVMAADGFELLDEEIILQVEYGDDEKIINAEIIQGSENVKIVTRDDKRIGLEISNEVKEMEYETDYNIIVRKADRDDFEYVLPGAELKIDIDNEIGPKGITKTDITDKNGEIAISNLNGTGTISIAITEITPPAGRKFNLQKKYVEIKRDLETGRMKLEVSENADTIIDNVNKIITIVVRNEIDNGLFTLAIDKRDKDNPELMLPDAELTLSLQDVLEVTEITDDKGTAYFKDLPMQNIGTYKFKIKEIKAPTGYKLLDEITLEVTFGGKDGKLVITNVKVAEEDKEYAEVTKKEDQYIRLNLYNEKDTGEGEGEGGNGSETEQDGYTFRINKVDEEYPEIGIEGVKFGVNITAESGETVYVEGKTDENGIFEINGLKGTGNIVAIIKELSGVNGYDIDTAEKEIEYVRNEEDKLIDITEIKGNMTGNTYGEEKNVEVYITNRLSDDYFNMHLEKFLSHINGEQISEGPTVVIEGDKVIYNKEEVTEKVKIGDELIYTIRVYNDGTQSGYAKTIIDDIPEGLDFIERHEINRKYEWKLTADGKVETNYLSKENEDNEGDNLIEGFDKEADTELDYRDIQIAFKLVGEKGGSSVANKAEIEETTDEDGDEVDNAGRNEIDDETKEEIEIGYVDLDTTKYISKIIVEDTGKNTIKEYEYGEEKDGVQKIEISRNRIDKTKISIEYTIKVTNKGNEAGPIEKLIDFIPEGLEFDESKNPGWVIVDGNAENIDLKGTILQPGESKEVKIIFTWKQSSTNFGSIKNIAIAEGGENEIDEGRDDELENTDNAGNSTIIIGVNTGGILIAEVVITIIILIVGVLGYKYMYVLRKKVNKR